jgi:hypothetical protein
MEPITASVIKRANYATLSQLCKQMGVEFQNQPKKQLIELLLSKLEQGIITSEKKVIPAKKKAKKIIQPKHTPVKKANNAKKATKSKTETKSSKILAMYLKGKKVSEISEALDAHPSFCYTVINKHKESKGK